MTGRSPEVSVVNINSTIAALRTLDRTAVRDFNRVIRAGLNRALTDARGRSPRRSGAMRAGMKIKKGRAKATSTGWSLISDTPQGQILELADHARTGQGAALVDGLTAKYGAPGRFIWDAWDTHRAQFNADVAAAVAQAAAQVQAAVNTARG